MPTSTNIMQINSKKPNNPCTRCGKQRIKSKTWKESVANYVGFTEITFTETVCPDPDCQKIVEKGLNQQREKREEIEKDRSDRKNSFKKATNKSNKSKKTPPKKSKKSS
jgi:hypothetical protein